MDLHFTSAKPTTEEKIVIDAAVAKISLTDTRPRRTHLLPLLQAIQNRVGWISEGALNYASQHLHVPPADAFGVANFYSLLSTRPQPTSTAHICDDIACKIRNADTLLQDVGTAGPAKPEVTLHRSPCLGFCEQAPAVLVRKAGANPIDHIVSSADVSKVVSALEGNCGNPPRLVDSVPQAGQPGLKLLRRIGRVDPDSLDGYAANGGFAALRSAIEMGPEKVIDEIIESRLVGRGGAAFSTGQKWKSVLTSQKPRYLICNADESEPGTFKDRVLMEGDPYALIESMIIAGIATGCESSYIYIRSEYSSAARLLQHAIDTCRSRGLLGSHILGQELQFDIEIRIGAGAYICGEETALLNSIEGYRGEPRNKPPFPTEVGLFGRPTVINNVETPLNVPSIVLEGGAAFAKIGTPQSTGTKVYCLSGHIVRPGVYEAPFGTTLQELLEMAGGIGGSGKLQALLIGGAAGAFIDPRNLDIPLTFEGCRAAGTSLGSAVVMAFDDTVDLPAILLRIASFFRDESCGQCVPCRVGTVRQEELLHRLSSGRPIGDRQTELVLLKEVGQAMRDASICGLGQTASSAIESAVQRFSLFEDKA
jgi:NADH-quinone oxidoreductase subunit F